MKIYLAAQYSRKDEMREYAEDLELYGHEVVSSWIWEPHPANMTLDRLTDGQACSIAMKDVVEVCQSDMMIFFAIGPATATARGGRHVEFGVAIARNKPIWVVGPKENIFHYLPNVRHFDSWNDLLNELPEPPVTNPVTTGIFS